MTSDNLPIELWTYIAGFCRRQSDLHSLSMVNTTGLYGVRPILFRKVVLRPSWVKRNASTVRNIIQEDASQLRFVFQVRVTSDVLTASEETCEMILNLLSGCKNAHAMILTEAGEKFLDLMYTGQWKSFSYPWEADNAAKFHLINFDKKGARRQRLIRVGCSARDHQHDQQLNVEFRVAVGGGSDRLIL